MDEIQPAIIQMLNIGNVSLNIPVCSLESTGKSQICPNVPPILSWSLQWELRKLQGKMQSACSCVSWIRLGRDQRHLPQVVPSMGAQGDPKPFYPPVVVSPGPLQSKGAACASALCTLASKMEQPPGTWSYSDPMGLKFQHTRRASWTSSLIQTMMGWKHCSSTSARSLAWNHLAWDKGQEGAWLEMAQDLPFPRQVLYFLGFVSEGLIPHHSLT